MGLKPQSHRIVRLLDSTIGCDLANVRPIGNVCYDLQKRSHSRAINTDSRRSMTRYIISKEIVRLVVAINDRSYDQSWPPTIDRTINHGIMHEQSIGGATGRKVARPVARLIVRPLTIWNSRFQVLNMTIDLVATDLPLAITHDLCDQSYDLCGQSYVLSSICPRLKHFFDRR